MANSYGGYTPNNMLGGAGSTTPSSLGVGGGKVMSPGDPRYPFLKYGYRTEAAAIAAGWKPTAAEIGAGYTPSTTDGTSTGTGAIETGNTTVDQLIAEYQKAYAEAKAENETRYQESLGLLEGQGETGKSDIRKSYAANQGSIYSNLVSRGLSGTTILPTMQTGNVESMNSDLARLQESINAQKLGVIQGREDTYPDQSALLNLIQTLGAYQNAGSVYTPMGTFGKAGANQGTPSTIGTGTLPALTQNPGTQAVNTSKPASTTTSGTTGTNLLNLSGSGLLSGLANVQNQTMNQSLADWFSSYSSPQLQSLYSNLLPETSQSSQSSYSFTPSNAATNPNYSSLQLMNLYDQIDNPYSYLYQ